MDPKTSSSSASPSPAPSPSTDPPVLFEVTTSTPQVGLGTGQFGRVSAHSVTQPVLIGFGQFQPAMNSKNGKSVGYSGRTNRVCAGRLVGLNVSSLIFSYLSRFHLLHCLPAISLKPTNPTLTPPSLSNPQIDKPTTTNNQTPIKKEERTKERVEERERKREKEKTKKIPFKPLGGNPSSFFLAKIPQRMAKRTRKMLRESQLFLTMLGRRTRKVRERNGRTAKKRKAKAMIGTITMSRE
jgi:hypothetical protein